MSDVPPVEGRVERPPVMSRREAVLALVDHIWSQPDPPRPVPWWTRVWRRVTRR